MGRYFGGRFGDMLSPTSTSPNTKAILSMRDHYYMKKISGGGIVEPATNVTELNSLVSWNFLPNGGHYTNTGFSETYYNGSRFRVMYNTGTVEFNSYEYPMYGKFDLRDGDPTRDCFFQLYGWQGTPANFTRNVTDGNLFQMGVYWESSPNTDNLTNSLEATNAVSSGEAAYFATAGYGTKDWSFYDGGSSSNSEGSGGTNREAQTSINWSGESITYICYGQNAGGNSRKVKAFKGDTLIRNHGSLITTGRPVYVYLGAGYPNGLHSIWSAGQPKFRYGYLDSGMVNI